MKSRFGIYTTHMRTRLVSLTPRFSGVAIRAARRETVLTVLLSPSAVRQTVETVYRESFHARYTPLKRGVDERER